MKQKGSISDNEVLVAGAIAIAILFIIMIIAITKRPTKPRVAKVSCNNKEIYVNLKTLAPVKKGTHEIGDTIRIEFPHIKDTNNNYIQLEGRYPIAFADRVDMAKNLAILYGIVTEEELALLKSAHEETTGNVTTIVYSK